MNLECCWGSARREKRDGMFWVQRKGNGKKKGQSRSLLSLSLFQLRWSLSIDRGGGEGGGGSHAMSSCNSATRFTPILYTSSASRGKQKVVWELIRITSRQQSNLDPSLSSFVSSLSCIHSISSSLIGVHKKNNVFDTSNFRFRRSPSLLISELSANEWKEWGRWQRVPNKHENATVNWHRRKFNGEWNWNENGSIQYLP